MRVKRKYVVLNLIFAVILIAYLIVGWRVINRKPEPEKLPYKAVVYDRSSKEIISYDAVCQVKGDTLYLYDATRLSVEDVSHMTE